MIKRRIITIEEFFRLKEMLEGLPEDQSLAIEVYNSQFQDKDMIDHLMAKALLFNNRKKFVDAVEFRFEVGSAVSLYNFIDIEEMNLVYKEILNKIIRDD